MEKAVAGAASLRAIFAIVNRLLAKVRGAGKGKVAIRNGFLKVGN